MVINGVNSQMTDWSSLGLPGEDTKRELRLLPDWQMKHVCREGDCTAHKLSRMATSSVLDEKLPDKPPDAIQECLLIKLSALSF